MFNGVPDQFHQFGPSLPFPLSFPLHHHHHHHHGPMSPSSSTTPSPLQSFPSGCFDLYPPPSVLQLQQSCIAKKEKEEEDAVAAGTGTGTGGSSNILATNNNVAVVLGMEDGVNDDERSLYQHHHHHHESSTFDDIWSNDEVVALFKIRSGLQENWFPDFTNWDHVSRKLAEVGYQRSAEKCKEKFEEESRQFNDDINYNKNYRFLTELNELYHHVEIPQIIPQKNPVVSQEQNGEEEKEKKKSTGSAAANPCQEIVVEKSVMKKRKRKKRDDNDDKFEMFMGFCGNVVKKVIEKQEEMHKKVLEDILKREEESIAREEAWRNQEISKIEKEIELRAQEKANASEKEAKMVGLLKNFMIIPPFDSLEDQSFFKKMQGLFMPSSNYSPQIQDNPQFKITQNPENFSGVNGGIVPLSSTLSLQKMEAFEAKDTGKRWPRDEVLALINIRCKLNNNSNNNEDKNSPGNKGTLWERISKGMMEMGYKRSAKRCKEKWENINKYFRKTKDIKKKRAEDSRTCPYFQQLSCLYSHQQQENDGLGHSDAPENR